MAAGARAYSIGFQDGRFYANGWHITGEMGGIYPPMKLADGIWFGIDDEWVKPATRFTSARGYARYAFPPIAGLRLARTDFVPDNRRAALTAYAGQPRAEGEDRDGQGRRPLRADGRLPVDRQRGHPTAADNMIDIPAYPGRPTRLHRPRHAPRRQGARLCGARRLHPRRRRSARPVPHFRGPQTGAVCADAATTSAPSACDDGPHGKGVGGQLRYRVTIGRT